MNTHAYFMDCMEGMRQYPDKYFDLAMPDPPYGIKENATRVKSRTKLAKTNSFVGSTWDNAKPSKQYFDELFRVSKHQIIWGGNYFIDHLYSTRCMIIWNKLTSGNFADCELAWTSFERSTVLFTYMWNGMNQGKSIREGHIMQGDKRKNEKRIHECQKPVALYKWILHEFAQPGWKILDTHLGSGSSRIAAHDMGFEFTGFENDPQHFGRQERRFKNHIKQLNMFHSTNA